MNYNNISEAHAWLIATMDDLKQVREKSGSGNKVLFLFALFFSFMHTLC